MKYILLLALTATSILGCISDQKAKPSTSEVKPTVESKTMSTNELYAGYYQNPTSLAEKEQNAIIDYIAEQNLDARQSPTGLYYHIKEPGDGDTFRRGDKLSVDYRGYFMDGKTFDSSYDRGRPLAFTVGQMIPGFNEVCYYLRPGGSATVWIPSRLGYGDRGMPGAVPPNSTLIFDIEVVEPK